MGIPSFFRWLVNKYPKIICNAVEEDTIEFDNFYLDVNGIIHHCFHPEDNNVVPPTTFEDVFRSMYECIDRLIHIVTPRKLLFLAIDGVAPRAKMNQLRARRFRNANEIQIAEEMEEKLREQYEREGKAVFPKEESEVADPNVITPGTEFMHELSQKLQCYISLRMKESPAWADIKVILSDDKVPGEGEHKIMSFIRAQRSSPGYDPNTRHCVYGLDADLIMLALATHEIHFSILRERQEGPCSVSIFSHITTMGLNKEALWSVKNRKPYQFVQIWVLREYLALDLEITSAENSECDLERIIDDFIFICFFAGNDFLPHIPSLEVREGCLDLLMHIYKTEFQNFGGYLVDMQKAEDKKGGYMELERFERFIRMVGSYEEKIFSKRSELRGRILTRILNEHNHAKECERDIERASDIAVSRHDADANEVWNNTKELNQKLKDYMQNQSDLYKDGGLGTDQVKFGTPGWRERYYEAKFHARNTQEIEATRKDVVAKYVEGLHWVLLHYFSSVPSWTWFYPYDYGPLASDFKGLPQTRVEFQKGLPFKPFDQLMGVLPPRSAHALPSAYKGLMIDQASNIIDLYPTEFETDTDGKRFLWQGIIKLPYIEDERLLTETKKLESELTDCEKLRNLESLDRLFFKCSSKDGQLLLQDRIKTASTKIKDAMAVESLIEGIEGTLHIVPEDITRAGDNNRYGGDARIDLCVFYEMNQCHGDVPRLLEHVNIPEKTVSKEDLMETILWHEGNNGNSFQNRGPIKPVHKIYGSASEDWRLKTPRDAIGCSWQRNYRPGPGSVQGTNTGAGVQDTDFGLGARDSYRASKSGTWRRDYYGGFQGLQTSGLNPRPVPNNRAWPTQAGDSYWTSNCDASKDWRLKVPSDEVIRCSWLRNNGRGPGPVRGTDKGCDANTDRW